MQEELVEQGVHLLSILAYATVAFILGGAGVVLESRSYAVYTTGDTTVALWMAGMGLVFLVFATLIARDKLLS